jgi:hypothetical protein
MATITKFDRTNLKAFRADINAALEAVFAKHGVTGNIGNISYDADEFRTKLTVNTVKTAAEEAEAERSEFELYAFRFGLTGKEFGKTFTHGGKSYEITGIKPRCRKYPILGTNTRGKTFKFPVDAAKKAA